MKPRDIAAAIEDAMRPQTARDKWRRIFRGRGRRAGEFARKWCWRMWVIRRNGGR